MFPSWQKICSQGSWWQRKLPWTAQAHLKSWRGWVLVGLFHARNRSVLPWYLAWFRSEYHTMGLTISSLFSRFFGKKQMRILMGRLTFIHAYSINILSLIQTLAKANKEDHQEAVIISIILMKNVLQVWDLYLPFAPLINYFIEYIPCNFLLVSCTRVSTSCMIVWNARSEMHCCEMLNF